MNGLELANALLQLKEPNVRVCKVQDGKRVVIKKVRETVDNDLGFIIIIE
jgi:hypothetical protein